jgi:glucose/arabinose dehydrogenase
MKRTLAMIGLGVGLCAAVAAARSLAREADSGTVLTGAAAFTSYEKEKPGVTRKITVADLPAPFTTKSVAAFARIVPKPSDAWPQTLPGFKVTMYASGFDNARAIRMAPNGDIFLAESDPGKIIVLHGMTASGQAESKGEFASGLHRPFGIAFYPLGPNPQYVYVGNTDSVVRFPYQNGDMKARGPAETVVKSLPNGDEATGGGGHWTRDVVFTRDGKKMLVSVGSRSNVAEGTVDDPQEKDRADVLEFNPDGSGMRIYASGIRNCVGEAIQPETGDLWCSTNERDGLGDNLPPDYITHVQEGGFYGWPWFYMGDHQDPRHAGQHAELRDKVLVPDVLLQPHNASLEMTFYEGTQFPQEYHGNIFASEHGSWNKQQRAGYEVIRVPVENGKATGAYEDFVTGFVTPDGHVWGRPVGIAVAKDGSLLFSDVASNTVWRVAYVGGNQ